MTQQPSLSAEQLRRIREVWQSNCPSSAEVSRAYARWQAPASRPMKRPWRGTWLIIAAGFLVGSGALAVTGALHPLSFVGAPRAASASRKPENPSLRKQSAVAPTPAVPPIALPSAVTSAPIPEAAQDRASAPHSPRGKGRGGLRSSAATAPGIRATTERGSWSEVAEAMQSGNEATVLRALEPLSHSEDAATRDAARLTRIQLQIAGGHADRVRIEVEQLAASGATPLVRRRAREIREQLAE